MTPALLVVALSVGQAPLPPELRQKQDSTRQIDPFLPDAVRGAVSRAVEAELDSKRGPGNARQILEAELAKYRGDRLIEMALNLRKAATVLRSKFRNNDLVKDGERYQQALSTYSKLDITDPGLRDWLDLTLKHNPDAAKQLKGRSVKVAVLTQGEGLDKKKFVEQLAAHFSRTGFKLVHSPVKTADYVVKVATLSSRKPGEKAVVRGTLEAESQSDKLWRRSLYRTEQAENPEVAFQATLEWLARMGAREVFFRFLRDALPYTDMTFPAGGGPQAHGDAHGRPAPRTVRIPKAEGQKPPPR